MFVLIAILIALGLISGPCGDRACEDPPSTGNGPCGVVACDDTPIPGNGPCGAVACKDPGRGIVP